jgi:hypothetical protein
MPVFRDQTFDQSNGEPVSGISLQVSGIIALAVNAIFDAHSRWVGEIPVNQRWVSNHFVVLLTTR